MTDATRGAQWLEAHKYVREPEMSYAIVRIGDRAASAAALVPPPAQISDGRLDGIRKPLDPGRLVLRRGQTRQATRPSKAGRVTVTSRLTMAYRYM